MIFRLSAMFALLFSSALQNPSGFNHYLWLGCGLLHRPYNPVVYCTRVYSVCVSKVYNDRVLIWSLSVFSLFNIPQTSDCRQCLKDMLGYKPYRRSFISNTFSLFVFKIAHFRLSHSVRGHHKSLLLHSKIMFDRRTLKIVCQVIRSKSFIIEFLSTFSTQPSNMCFNSER